MLKNERVKVPRRKYTSRQRTSKYMGVGSSNRKNQWQARILVHGKVGHTLCTEPQLACIIIVLRTPRLSIVTAQSPAPL